MFYLVRSGSQSAKCLKFLSLTKAMYIPSHLQEQVILIGDEQQGKQGGEEGEVIWEEGKGWGERQRGGGETKGWSRTDMNDPVRLTLLSSSPFNSTHFQKWSG